MLYDKRRTNDVLNIFIIYQEMINALHAVLFYTMLVFFIYNDAYLLAGLC